MIKIAVNGGREDAPSTPEEIADDVATCAAAGATVFHVHARDAAGRQSLLAEDTDRVVRAIRARTPHISLGLTTGAWILPDVRQRLEAIAAWHALPDFASVNFDEEGCEEVARTLLRKGVGVEAGILDRASTERFLASGIPALRILIELQEQQVDAAVATADIIERALGDYKAPRLLHGHGAVVWQMLDEAVRRGYDSRIGLEDVSEQTTNLALWKKAQLRLKLAR